MTLQNQTAENDSLIYSQIDSLTTQLILRLNNTLSSFLSLRGDLGQTQETLRVSEIYQAIQTQQNASIATASLRKSIKKRTYLTVGIGVASSALLFFGNDSNNNNFRYGSTFLSLSVPIISLISMNRQLNRLIPVADIDYSMLKQNQFPINQATKDFSRNYIKMQIDILSKVLGKLDNSNAVINMQLKNNLGEKSLKTQVINSLANYKDLDNHFINKISELKILIEDPYYLVGFDNSSRKGLLSLAKLIDEKLTEYVEMSGDIKTIIDCLNQYLLIAN